MTSTLILTGWLALCAAAVTAAPSSGAAERQGYGAGASSGGAYTNAGVSSYGGYGAVGSTGALGQGYGSTLLRIPPELGFFDIDGFDGYMEAKKPSRLKLLWQDLTKAQKERFDHIKEMMETAKKLFQEQLKALKKEKKESKKKPPPPPPPAAYGPPPPAYG